ncbi:MAG: hypothetical protein ACI8P9_005095 [Parasphingorhabdus sp.]|jgi:hypothetical protein
MIHLNMSTTGQNCHTNQLGYENEVCGDLRLQCKRNNSCVFMLQSTICSTWEGTWSVPNIIETSGSVRIMIGVVSEHDL